MSALPSDVLALTRSPIIYRAAQETGQCKSLVVVLALVAIQAGENFNLTNICANLDVEPDVVLQVMGCLSDLCREMEGL